MKNMNRSNMLTKHAKINLPSISYVRWLSVSSWIPYFAMTHDMDENKRKRRDIIESFWEGALKDIRDDTLRCEIKLSHVENSKDEYVDPITRTIKVPKPQFVNKYKKTVFDILENHRYEINDANQLQKIQEEIEDLTLNFSESNIHKTCPDLLLRIIKNDLPSAKEYLRGKYLLDKEEQPGRIKVYPESQSADTIASKLSDADKKNLRSVLSDDDKSLLEEFGEYTIECLLVHTLGQLFNIDNIVSVASLIDRIEHNVRHYITFLFRRRSSKPDDEGTKMKALPFGTALLEFLVDRELLLLETYNTDLLNLSDSSGPMTVVKKVVKKSNNYYRSSFLYAKCNFEPSLLPIKLNLPMVFPPKDWEYRKHKDGNKKWIYISDIYGGYLSNPTGLIYSSQRIMSSSDAKNFFIYFGECHSIESEEKVSKFCKSISSLQRQAFKINVHLLTYINKYRELFEECGYLFPDFLSKVILSHASGILRSHYDKNKEIKNIYKFSEVYSLLIKNMQRARYECTILDLAKAYSGYSIYFPAFIDFRGRIYRSGIFHFHERDLARSLLLIDCKNDISYLSDKDKFFYIKNYIKATRFLYQSYKFESIAYTDMYDKINEIYNLNKDEELSDVSFIQILLRESQKAKLPFQYLSNNLIFFGKYISRENGISIAEMFNCVPLSQDASASAYQLMAYFLLDTSLAKQTNLIYTGKEILDIYSHIRIDLIEFLKESLSQENPELCAILDRVLTRSIVKRIFMPIIYGKTANSTTKDLIEALSQDVLPKECFKLSGLCFKFWKIRYSYMDAFIRLICLVGRFCSSHNRAVLYNAKYFSTSQDYKKMEKHSVRVFDSNTRKPHNVTLSFPSNVPDKRKSRISTFVNFIHQKDAQIAMTMAFNAREYEIPLYTVHDNFITNTINSVKMSHLYLDVIKEMGPPLSIINRFLFINIIEPVILDCDNINYNIPLDYYDNNIIPDSVLDTFLNHGGIPQSEVRNVAGWKKITEQLKQGYNLYCKAVCGPKKTFYEHKSLWNDFKKSLNGPYCLHN